MLEYMIRHGAERGADSPTLVLLHGRGSDMHDLFSLAPALPGDWNVISAQAPFSGAAWGYGPGWAWYRYRAEDRVVDETLQESLGALDDFLGAVPGLVEGAPGPLVLGGFSQGGTTSLAYALTRPGSVPGVLNLSGFLADSPGVEATPDTVDGVRVFWGHGTQDPAIPFGLAIRGREKLQEAGADLTVADHHGGHFISREELEAAVGWIRNGSS